MRHLVSKKSNPTEIQIRPRRSQRLSFKIRISLCRLKRRCIECNLTQILVMCPQTKSLFSLIQIRKMRGLIVHKVILLLLLFQSNSSTKSSQIMTSMKFTRRL
jgi:hypothetical protein